MVEAGSGASKIDLDLLYREIADPASWHWKVDVKTGWFAHHPESAEGVHVRAVLDGLRATGNEAEAIRLVTALESVRAVFSNDGHKEAADAISLVLEQARIVATENGFSVPDLPEDVYTKKYEEDLTFPGGLAFALSQGGLLQSAREAVVHRLRVGKSDLAFYYLTRTAAIYFRENGQTFVAFDDDPEENILLVRTEEGRNAGSNWLVDVRDPLIANAIVRAKATHRVAPVTGENVRTDVGVCTAMIGDVTEKYVSFIEKHRGKKLQMYVLETDRCKNVTENTVLIRCVLVGVVYYSDLSANDYFANVGRARGVQKISTGNGGSLVPYVGLLLNQRNPGLFSSVPELLSFFNGIERRLSHDTVGSFYGGLGVVLDQIHTREDIERFLVFFQNYGHHKEWVKRPLLLKYAFETFCHDQERSSGLLDRLRSRREARFKLSFLRRAFAERYHDTITDEELTTAPSSSLFKMVEGADISPEEIAQARAAIVANKKSTHFPLNKIYYQQSARGTKIERMALDSVRQAVLDVISVTATVPGRWQARHDEAKARVASFLNNPAKAQELINFFQSAINQGSYFKEIATHHKKIQGAAAKDDIIAAVAAIRSAAERSKYDTIKDEQYRQKMEPLNDILTMLKSQTDDTATEVRGVLIKTQTPSITDLVDYDTVHCCALFPYHNEDGILGYLEDEHSILLQYFTTGKRGLLTIYGVIICVLCEDDVGNTVLLVDSAEGDENWLKAMKHWQATYHDCIKQLAKDSGANGVFYGNNAGNTVPKEFLKYLSEQLPLKTIALRKKNDAKRYLETFSNGHSGSATGYYEPV